MQTSARTVAETSRVLGLPAGRLTWSADVLRAAGMLPSHQGRQVQLDGERVALIVLAAIVGPPTANKPARLAAYARARTYDGESLQAALARWLGSPGKLVRLTIDLATYAATAVEMIDGTPRVLHFGHADTEPLRTATLTGDRLAQLSAALAATPSPRRRTRN